MPQSHNVYRARAAFAGEPDAAISTSTTQYKIEGRLMSRLDGKVAVITAEQRYWAGDRTKVCPRRAYGLFTGRRQSELDKAKP